MEAHRSHVTELIQKLGDHLKSHDQAAANEMMCDFIANRLPPYLKDAKAGETKGKFSKKYLKNYVLGGVLGVCKRE